ncbi:unnamed protein product [Urochloa decumbens]|uniref:BED-type domain-containing protein n=1 Tax=Urochloa decumbens TaxID=240449 RepID=A0ABC9F8B1_9POAL
MEAVDPHVVDAVLWLAQTILEVLFASKMEEWIRQVGLADDTEELKSEIERAEAVVAGMKGRAAEYRPLARSLGRLKEMLYDADDMVDELDYYRLQHQVEGVTFASAIEPEGMDGDGAEQVDASRDNAGMLSSSSKKKRSKAWEEFRVTEEDGKPVKAECIHCHVVLKCETSSGTSVLHNHLKSGSCKLARERAARGQAPNPSSADDGAQNGRAIVPTHDPDSRKRKRIDEMSAHDTAANTHLWNKAEFCSRIQQTTQQLQKAISEVQKLYGSGSVASSNLCQNTAADACRRTSSLIQHKIRHIAYAFFRFLQQMLITLPCVICFNCLVSLRHLNMPKGVYSSIAGIGKMTSLQELHDFSVESSSSSNITGLQFLDELLQLGVSQLKNIGTRDEAYGAKMRDKQHLEKLHLSWNNTLPQDEYASDEWSESEDESLSSESEDERLPVSNRNLVSKHFTDTARDVLEGLEPHGNLKHLRVSGYSSAISPAWLGTSVTCLQTLHLEDCGKLKILPPLERLSFLTKLVLRNMQSVIEVSIPSLEELVMIKMPKLERCFCNSFSDLNSRLTVLKMRRCRVLKAFPLFESCKKLKIEHKSWLPCLNELTLYKCPCLKVLNPLPPSSKFCKLDIARVSTLPTMERSFSEELIIGLKDWDGGEIDENSNGLTELDDRILSFHNLRALSLLHIAGCQKLSSISLEGFRQLISLKSLEIKGCNNLFSSDILLEHAWEDMANTNFNAFPSLEHLKIEKCGITGKWLSVMLRHAPALEELHLNGCNQISGLLIEGRESSSSNHTSAPWAPSAGNPGGTLTSSTPEGLLRIPSTSVSSLKEMSIRWCKELTFQGNKEDFSGFTSLEELTVWGCPKVVQSLVQKYENNDQRNGRWLLPHSLVKLDIDRSPETLQPCFLEDSNCLRELAIIDSPSLKFLQLCSCTALEELMVNGCESLAVLEGNFSCLKELMLFNSGLELLQLYSCTALEELMVEHCGSLIALEGNFTCLRKLYLQGNPKLKYLQLRFCTALEDLIIENCESLDALEDLGPLGGLRNLKVLGCPGLSPYLERLLGQDYELCAGLERLCTDDYSFLTTSFCMCLTSLQRLQLHEGPEKVTRLTDEQERALRLLTSLQGLRFEYCSNLAGLPVGLRTLSSLKRLEIYGCWCISRLPEKGLPPSLEELEISYGCSKELADECRMLAGTRSKPKVKIHSEYVNFGICKLIRWLLSRLSTGTEGFTLLPSKPIKLMYVQLLHLTVF